MGLERRESQAERTVVAVGLTGSIGAGKSTALGMFGALGALVFSADDIVHELYCRPGVVSLVAEHFGRQTLASDGSIDRASLAAEVRHNSDELRWLEGVTHPLVAEQITGRIENATAGSVVVCEVPLMFETGFERLFDLVVTVEADPETRRSRSTHGFGLEQFSEFEALQASTAQRIEGSDLVYFNDGDLEGLRRFVGETYERARRLVGSQQSEDGR